MGNMKRARSVSDDSDGSDEESSDEDDTFHCNACETTKACSEFSRWSLEHNHHQCRECSNARSREADKLRQSSLGRSLIAKLRRMMNKAGTSLSKTQRLKLSDMESFVQCCGSRSLLSGISGIGKLTLARWDCNKPPGLNNVIICTHAEAREHNRRGLGGYHPRFVDHVNTRIITLADNDNQCDNDSQDESQIYPPLSPFKRGLALEVVTWFVKHLDITHPKAKATTACRADKLFRIPTEL